MRPVKLRRPLGIALTATLLVGLVAYAAGTHEGVGRAVPTTKVLGETLVAISCPTTPATPPNFSICGPALGSGPIIYPGAPAANLPITFYNPNNVEISVTSFEVKFDNTVFPTTPSPGCDPSEFVVGGLSSDSVTSGPGATPDVTITFGSSFIVPAAVGATPGQAVYRATLALLDGGDQDACENLPLSMTYSAAGQSTLGPSCVVVPSAGATIINNTYKGNYEVKGGTTVWLEGGTISGNVTVDNTGQFIATLGTINGNLTSNGGNVDLEGTTVTGNVQATNGGLGLGAGTTIGGNVQVTSGPTPPPPPPPPPGKPPKPGLGTTTFCSNGTASAPVFIGGTGPKPPGPPAPGKDYASLLYYTGSSIPPVTPGSPVTVYYDDETAITAATYTDSTGTHSITPVPSTVGLSPAKTFDSNGGSASTATAHEVALTFTPHGTGPVTITVTDSQNDLDTYTWNAPPPPPTPPSGKAADLQIQNLASGSPAVQVCGTWVTGNLQFQNNAVGATFGGSSGCPADTVGGIFQAMNSTGNLTISGSSVSGNLQVQNNTGSLSLTSSTVGGNLQVMNNAGAMSISANSSGGNLQVQNNTGGGTVTSNTAGNNCQVQGNKPGITGSGNSGKNNTCNIGSPGA